MQNLILGLHSLNRWLIVAVGLAAIVILAVRLANKDSFDGPVRGLTAAFSGLMDLQMLLGLIYFIWNGLAMGMLFAFGTPLIRHRWEHLFVMVLAVAAAHLPSRWKDEPDQLRLRNTLIAIVISMTLVVVGVLVLGAQYWIPRWPF
jgi:uncharacterized membrane protein YfhO